MENTYKKSIVMKDIKSTRNDYHAHCCKSCGILYSHHYKFESLLHKQNPFERPNLNCGEYYGKILDYYL